MVDFAGADRIRPGRYSPADVLRIAAPKLRQVRQCGCQRLLECTPNFLGRDPALMLEIGRAAGIEIWTNTGLYGAGGHKYLPQYAFQETAARLARRWIGEFEKGVDGVRPRFVKIGVNAAPLSETDRKLARAAAITSRETGLTAASHTGGGVAAMEQIAVFEQERVPPSRFVWVHAQSEKDRSFHERAARAGAWVEFDGIAPETADWHLECLRLMSRRGLLGKALISQDAGWYHVGEPGGGDYRGYTYLYTGFLPRLDPAWARLLLVVNPGKAFGFAAGPQA
ncbi:MAG: hypothetical protein IT158_20910 [Bryobacterales bacterium]|nr:hypothetical protein [Bryobacterales bacterium]